MPICISRMKLPELSNIKRLRTKLGITQTELAKMANVSQSLIARLEKGTVDPRYSKVAGIFNALDELKKEEITAGELMSKEVVNIQATDTIKTTINIMNKFKVSQMPVFNKKKVVGSISEKVILDEIGKGVNMQDLSHRLVGNFMDPSFPTVNMNTPITTLSKLLEHDNAVLVMVQGSIKGIITKTDLLKVVSQ